MAPWSGGKPGKFTLIPITASNIAKKSGTVIHPTIQTEIPTIPFPQGTPSLEASSGNGRITLNI